jgi:hypothetical protein
MANPNASRTFRFKKDFIFDSPDSAASGRWSFADAEWAATDLKRPSVIKELNAYAPSVTL